MSNKYIKEIVLHMTSIDNVEAILASGALMAKSVLDANNTFYENIAHQNIQDRRQLTPVLKGARGSLHDYVPFYFAARSPFTRLKTVVLKGFQAIKVISFTGSVE